MKAMFILAHAGISDITPEQGEQIQHFLSYFLPILMAMFPLGCFFCHSFVLGTLAFLQIAIVLLTVVYVYRSARRHNRGELHAGCAAVAGYFVSCFLTNFLGMLVMEGRFRW
ncbi:MAG: hypothetical protein QOE70_5518 [Chthoniobacter sp.]|jgi:hypothetical protein|nr:hypothetical protein [Chthoniobacter sp.]